MIRLETPPEFADAGYWYTVEAMPDPNEGGRTPGDIPAGWCAWYATINGIDYATFRTPTPIAGVPTADVTVKQAIGGAFSNGSIPAARKPFGRIGGL